MPRQTKKWIKCQVIGKEKSGISESARILIINRKTAIERLAKWLHDDTLRTDKWEDMPNKPLGRRMKYNLKIADGKDYWRETAERAIKMIETG